MTNEIYLKREEIKWEDLHPTLCNLLKQLRERTQAETNKFETHQLCIQLGANNDGDVWLMFVYFDTRSETFYFSYQDTEYNDTDITYGFDHDQMMQQITDEIMECDFEWVELD